MTMYFLWRRISSPLSRFSVFVPSEGTEPASSGRVPSGASPTGTCSSSMLLFLFSILLGLFNGPVNVCFLSPQGIRQPAQGIREAAFPKGSSMRSLAGVSRPAARSRTMPDAMQVKTSMAMRMPRFCFSERLSR
ncbi:hypothetical protein ACIXKU_14915 [Bacteroides fragilis]